MCVCLNTYTEYRNSTTIFSTILFPLSLISWWCLISWWLMPSRILIPISSIQTKVDGWQLLSIPHPDSLIRGIEIQDLYYINDWWHPVIYLQIYSLLCVIVPSWHCYALPWMYIQFVHFLSLGYPVRFVKNIFEFSNEVSPRNTVSWNNRCGFYAARLFCSDNPHLCSLHHNNNNNSIIAK